MVPLLPAGVRLQTVQTEAGIDRRERRFIALVGELLDDRAVIAMSMRRARPLGMTPT
ncbi:hypothetical protein RLEG12_08930 (plasmid) [Rhizobium leguminosarum bv. trifolii CB782]|nr:hypothetical protein RLEG12_08930 [Rhizobium leguminosarum bv. trifolii CB782]